VYLPSNGCSSKEEVLAKLVVSESIVFGVGVYLAGPFLVPVSSFLVPTSEGVLNCSVRD
jgi:hypothetical protein